MFSGENLTMQQKMNENIIPMITYLYLTTYFLNIFLYVSTF